MARSCSVIGDAGESGEPVRVVEPVAALVQGSACLEGGRGIVGERLNGELEVRPMLPATDQGQGFAEFAARDRLR